MFGDRKPMKLNAFLTHLHWDHVMGLPFFGPALRPDTLLEVYGPPQEEGTLQEVMTHVVKPPFFPVHMHELEGSMVFRELADDKVVIGSTMVRSRMVPHVGTTLGFRIEAGGHSLAYISDHQAPEIGVSPQKRGHVAEGVLELCDGVDVLIHDGQYTKQEFATVKGTWGHSTVDYAVHVAAEAGARRLVIFHHDPAHNDAEVDELLEIAMSSPGADRLDSVLAAEEGMTLDVGLLPTGLPGE